MWNNFTVQQLTPITIQSGQITHRLYRAQQVRELDRVAIEKYNTPGITLMEHAGNALFSALRLRWPRMKRIAIMCGMGNNGGDGYIVARLADYMGIRVVIYQLGDVEKLTGDALTAFERLEGSHVEIHHYDGQPLENFDVVVDAMLGTGLKGEVQGNWRLAIDAINIATQKVDQNTRIVACDIPSGLHADTGRVLGSAVRADLTVTFIGLKQGLFTAMGPEFCGEIVFDDLHVDSEIYSCVENNVSLLSVKDTYNYLGFRPKSSHKGQCGHVLIVGGNVGMSGAVRMAGEAAYRVGAGLVTIATRSQHAPVINMSRPELMCYGIENTSELSRLLSRATVVAIGPGLGQDQWAQDVFNAVVDSHKPLIVDADAINLLAFEPVHRENWVLTPHPGEAANLLGSKSSEIQADRFNAVSRLHEKYGGVVVLKGSGTLVYDSFTHTYICPYGNPGMASGGMGDVLTGVISGFAAQGVKLEESARAGVSIHAYAADLAAGNSPRGLLASDLFPYLRQLVNY